MSEKDKFIKEKESNSFGVDASKLKHERKNYLSFSTNYLPLNQQITLIFKKNITIFLRNRKSLVAIFLSPIIFLLILQTLQFLADSYTENTIIREHTVYNIDQVSLKCFYPVDCLSLGIAVIVLLENIKSRARRV